MRSATKLKIGKDPDYVAWLHDKPCVCCWLAWFRMGNLREKLNWVEEYLWWAGDRAFDQRSKTEAAHVAEYERMAAGCTKHALELERYRMAHFG